MSREKEMGVAFESPLLNVAEDEKDFKLSIQGAYPRPTLRKSCSLAKAQPRLPPAPRPRRPRTVPTS